ncbi:helix-turn-helix transcriptional regulator [Halomonas halocynthiae]|uniref:helix-turn-helix transcriptional regulator n=1 Tax=Halomonas halocynthiae TaxID=176290 RepID=UPI00041C82B7|nr:LuxR C-terminal-related transcriptional regulator [Halomonas halocynthiae]
MAISQSEHLPPASLAPVARLAGLVRSPDFLCGLGRTLEDYFPNISQVLFHFDSRGRPSVLTHNLSGELNDRVLKPYVERMYLLDPFHQHWKSTMSPGLWTLDELAPDGFRDSDYFATYYRNLGLYDEAAAFFDLHNGNCLSLSFGFYQRKNSPNQAELLATLRYLFPLLNSLIHQFWLASSLNIPATEEKPILLKHFGQGKLSDRERETAWLILRGYTGPEMAKSMNITLGTVKNHRKRLYSKLNISSQAELFRQFMLFQHSEGRKH